MPLIWGPRRAEKTLMAGIVEALRADDAQELAAGAVVRTDADASSVAEVVHRNGAVTRLDRDSEAVIDRAVSDGRPRVIVTLGPGRTWHQTAPLLDDAAMYEARCPAAVLTARAAVFSVTCRADGSVDIAAVTGNVVVRGLASGSVALGDGQRVTVSGTGVFGEVENAGPDAEWVEINNALDQPVPAEPESELESDDASEPAAEEPKPLPRWVGRTAAVVAVVAFAALLAGTFASADRGAQTAAEPGEETVQVRSPAGPVSPLPAGAAAMLQAEQDRRVASEPREAPEPPAPTRVTAKAPATTAAPAPAPAAAPASATAKAVGTSCSRQGGSVVFSGRVTNTSSTASRFAVDTVFKTSGGRVFASKTATTSTLAPGKSSTWSVSVRSSGSGGSCDVVGVRPA